MQTGEDFLMFQDRADIAWGQNWQRRIEQALDGVTLLLVIITPGFFRSTACREEVERFVERERALGRDDLILPVYYVSAPELDIPARRDEDKLANLLASRQLADWRELRFEPLTSPVARKALAQLGSRMRDAFWHPPANLGAHALSSEPEATVGQRHEGLDQAGQVRLTAKSEPPTHVVDAYQRGDFATVSEAVEAAQPGDRILVRPGLYIGGLVIDKPLEILGDGPAADIEIRASDADAVFFQANIGRIANLTLRHTGSEDGWFGIDITQGRLDLEGCDISSESLACVAIRDGADPRLRRNTIRDGKGDGVLVYDGGLGTLEDNDITANGSSGVSIGSGGNPTLRRNTIHANEESGVCVNEGGLGKLEDNDITTHPSYPGVTIESGGNPTLRRNSIHDNEGGGVHVYDGGLGTLEDNDITANGSSGVSIGSGGNPTLRRNTIHDGKTSGVHVYEGGLGTLEDNDITANANPGVSIDSGGNPTLRRNRLNRNTHYAAQIYPNGRGTFEDNDMTSNERGAWNIDIESQDAVTCTRNRE